MSNAIGYSRESNPSRKICHLRAVPLVHVADIVSNWLTENAKNEIVFPESTVRVVFDNEQVVGKTICQK